MLYKNPAPVVRRFEITLTVILSGAAVLIATEATQAQGKWQADGNTTALLMTTVAGVFTLILTNVFQMWRERRHREWDVQDREQARKDAKFELEQTRIETLRAAEIVRVSTEKVAADALKAAEIVRLAAARTAAELVEAASRNKHIEKDIKSIAKDVHVTAEVAAAVAPKLARDGEG